MKETRWFDLNDGIVVRPITMEDTDYIVAWRNNPRVRDNFIYRAQFTSEGHRKWMETKVESGEVEQFVILYKGLPVGSVYFRDINPTDFSAEYGIFIGDDTAIGHGIGSQVAAWAVDYGFTDMQLRRIILRVFADNTAALRSYEKAGFRQTERLHGFYTEDNGDCRDLIMMAVCKEG